MTEGSAAVADATVIAAQNLESVRIEGMGQGDVIDASGYTAHGVTIRGNGGADFLYADGDGGFTDTLDGGGSPGPVPDALHADAEDDIIA